MNAASFRNQGLSGQNQRNASFDLKQQRKRGECVQGVINCFNQENGDELDRHIFMKEIIDYLEVNIDGIRRKYNLERPSLGRNF